MNKSEAINAMQHGKVVTHRFFSDDEYIYMKEGYIVTEEGYKCTPSSFWSDRSDANWNEDWSVKSYTLEKPVYYPKTTDEMMAFPFTVSKRPITTTNGGNSPCIGFKTTSKYGSISKFNRK